MTPTPRPATVFAWLVHGYTASGAVLGFMALLAVAGRDFRSAFLWLTAATIVDATDGWLARRVRVADRAAAIDGAHLDDIVDYVTYVFVPAYLIYQAGLLPDTGGVAIAGAILVASAYAFARRDAKTSDHFFTGFPSYWNVVALYLYLGGLSARANAGVLLALCVLVFVPTTYVYPSRTPVLRRTTLVLGAAWGAALLGMILRLPDRSGFWTAASLMFPVYYTTLSAVLHRRRRAGP